MHHHPVCARLDHHPEAPEALGHGDDAIALLHAQLGRAPELGRALGEGRGHGQDRGLVEAGDFRALDGRRLERRVAGPQLVTLRGDLSPHPPKDLHESIPRWADVKVADREVGARDDARRHHPEGGLGGVAGHVQGEGP